MFKSLRPLSDQQVLTDTDAIVVQDRKLTVRMLEHLHEIERRKLYLKLGYGSMFLFCTRRLRFSEPAATRRIRTARVLARYPRLHDMLQSGDVNLTTASMVLRLLKPDNADAIFGRIKGKSKREVERIIAELEPTAVLPPDRVQPLIVAVVRTAENAPVTSAGDREKSPNLGVVGSIVECAPSASTSCSAALTESDTSRGAIEFERFARVEFTAHESLMLKLERIRSLLSHRLPMNASLEQLIDYIADYVITREDPNARHQRREARASAQQEAETRGSNNPRHISAQVRDEVYLRDKRCTYVGPDGKRCESTAVLQIDHINPVARGGAGEPDNLRVLCGPHNRLESERLMGPRKKSTVT